MSDKPATPFTAREAFLVSYYRDPNLSKARALIGYDLAFAITSLCMMWLFYSSGEPFNAFVAYALLLGRLYYLVTEGTRYTEDFRSIFNKYEARIAELEHALAKQRPPNS